MSLTYQQIAAEAQADLDAKIPQQWRISPSILSSLPRNIKPLFASAGILSDRELEITTVKDATSLLEKIHSGAWSAEEVTVAFCKRAAMAQQLVKPLMDMDFDGAIKRAKELDQYFKESCGKVVGPLHGLPISLKDLTDVKGMKVTIGYIAWAKRTAPTDAVLVQTLRKAGCIIYVKTTMPQTGMVSGEGALNACLGAPIGIATDIGGSIRAPSAFNGLYSIKPSSRRISYAGNNSTFSGQIAILATAGPIGRSVRDLKLLCEIFSKDEHWLKDPVIVDKPWISVDPPKKATIGVLWWDEVVMPHPPIQRALKETVEKLRAAGHEVIDFLPFEHQRGWDITAALYFATGGREIRDKMAETSEPCCPAADRLISQSKPLSISELYKYHARRDIYKTEYMAHWNATSEKTSSGKPVGAILCPAGPCASFPHDFLPWWPYFSTWNILDYPCVIMPVTRVSASLDPVDTSYTPTPGPDKENYDIYDPELYNDMPVALQLVGRGLAEEKLLAVAETVDAVVNGGKSFVDM